MIDYCIVILSCSAFSDMWENDLFLYNKFWPQHKEIRIISDGGNQFGPNNPKELFIYFGGMSDRLIKALSNIKNKYVFLSFDDYYPCKMVDGERIDKLIAKIDSIGADYCRIFKRPFARGKKEKKYGYRILPLSKVYQVNFYPCIWKTKSLLSVLKSGEDIWKTEVRLTRRSREKQLLCLYVHTTSIFPFKDIVRKGKYKISGRRYIKKSKLSLSNRETRTLKETCGLFFRTVAMKCLPSFIKNALKNMLRKKGKFFYSDYEETDD